MRGSARKSPLYLPFAGKTARIPLKVPDDMKRDLELAKVEDHIEISARIRAMISLWQDGGEFRDQVDRLARTTGRPRRT